jgi:hypothetical protein
MASLKTKIVDVCQYVIDQLPRVVEYPIVKDASESFQVIIDKLYEARSKTQDTETIELLDQTEAMVEKARFEFETKHTITQTKMELVCGRNIKAI